MLRLLTIFTVFLAIFSGPADAATARSAKNTSVSARSGTTPSDFVTTNTYQNLYPYMNNTMRTDLNPGTTGNTPQSSISALTRTNDTTATKRRVVARSGTNSAGSGVARSATNSGGTTTATTRGTFNTPATNARAATNTANRRVVARSSRGDGSYVTNANNAAINASQSSGESLPADRCLADYTACMNNYCSRPNTSYNRCYCSARLTQIDAEYQPAIDSLIKQLLTIKGTTWTADEMNEYWDETIGQYTGDNSWINLENALDIDWSDTESRVRGQNAFLTGHEYCSQHLRGCAYMATNMRDVYRSDIARDCATYEKSLQRIKNAAESILEAYSD